jgi:serine/threonine-protein kinase
MRVELTFTEGPEKGRVLRFDEPDCFLFGRAEDARISIPGDPHLSRHHFLLEISPPDCKVTDLDSKNGVVVNSMRYGGRKPPAPGVKQAPEGLMEALLQDGDEIAVGMTRMRIGIRMDAICGDCGRRIPEEEAKLFASAGLACLCESCRHKSRKIPVAGVGPAATAPARPEPKARRRTILCARCRRDATAEAGIRGQAEGAEYVCRSCRDHEEEDPEALLRSILDAAGGEPPPVPATAPAAAALPGAPAIKGYRIRRRLGKGGMGMVYQAEDLRSGRDVVIKTMLPQVAADPDKVRAFQREIDVNRQLRHPNIVSLLDQGRAMGTFYCVLEYVEGMDLGQYVEKRGGRLTLDDAIPLLRGALEGLAYAHTATVKMPVANDQVRTFTGIVHRDLKPQNILLEKDGERWIPKIADFGLSKSFAAAGLTDITVPGFIAGTPIYWPREQITHYKYLCPATDVFSAAAVFYEAVTGRYVREGFLQMQSQCQKRKRRPGIPDFMRVIGSNPTIPIRQRDPKIPAPVAEVLDRALKEAEVPTDEARMRLALSKLRYRDAGAFLEALDAALSKS